MTKTTNKNNKGVAKINSDVFAGSYDEIMLVDEKEREKQVSLTYKKEGKQLQLAAKINDIRLRLTKAENRYKVSLTDPQIDTVAVAIEVKCLREEQLLAKTIFNQLFPNATFI